jgi:hypothetical protein
MNLKGYDQRLDPVEDWEPQTWECQRCDFATADPLWLHGDIVCHQCYYDDPDVQAALEQDDREDRHAQL